jgi:hypothetical protein
MMLLLAQSNTLANIQWDLLYLHAIDHLSVVLKLKIILSDAIVFVADIASSFHDLSAQRGYT